MEIFWGNFSILSRRVQPLPIFRGSHGQDSLFYYLKERHQRSKLHSVEDQVLDGKGYSSALPTNIF